MWIKLDDKIAHHPKLIAAGPVASWMQVCALAYSAEYLTDGFIPEGAVSVLGAIPNPHDEAARLVRCGLWGRVEGGYQIHDYHLYQPSAQEVIERRRRRAEAGRKGGLSKHSSTCLAQTTPNASTNDSTLVVAKRNPVPVPDPDPDPRSRTPPDGGGVRVVGASEGKRRRRKTPPRESPPGFDAFWRAYPKPRDRGDAEVAWLEMGVTEELAETTLIPALLAQSQWPEWQEDGGKYIPWPAKWLRHKRWLDQRGRGGGTGGLSKSGQATANAGKEYLLERGLLPKEEPES